MSINADILYKIDSEIGKDKKVVELQREIERLNQELRGLNNCIIEFHSEFCNKQAEINRLNNIINEFEDILKRNIKACNNKFENMFDRNYRRLILEEKLEQLQELKGSGNNE